MRHWELLDTAKAPGAGTQLRLYQSGDEFCIKAGKFELMNSHVHGSEDALAELACARIAGCSGPTVLIGGLGMGFTLAAALRGLGPDARVVVAELVPAVVEWNFGPLASLAGRPLEDPRVTVREEDVGLLMDDAGAAYDVVLLDVDNGPEGLTREENDWLYGLDGLALAYSALRPGGVLAVWSASPDRDFVQRLRKTGFDVDELRVRAHGSRRGPRHTVWLAGRSA